MKTKEQHCCFWWKLFFVFDTSFCDMEGGVFMFFIDYAGKKINHVNFWKKCEQNEKYVTWLILPVVICLS